MFLRVCAILVAICVSIALALACQEGKLPEETNVDVALDGVPSQAVVGEIFDVEFSIHADLREEHDTALIDVDEEELGALFYHLPPGESADPFYLPEAEKVDGDLYRFTERFTCSEEGEGVIVGTVEVYGDEGQEFLEESAFISKTVTCVAASNNGQTNNGQMNNGGTNNGGTNNGGTNNGGTNNGGTNNGGTNNGQGPTVFDPGVTGIESLFSLPATWGSFGWSTNADQVLGVVGGDGYSIIDPDTGDVLLTDDGDYELYAGVALEARTGGFQNNEYHHLAFGGPAGSTVLEVNTKVTPPALAPGAQPPSGGITFDVSGFGNAAAAPGAFVVVSEFMKVRTVLFDSSLGWKVDTEIEANADDFPGAEGAVVSAWGPKPPDQELVGNPIFAITQGSDAQSAGKLYHLNYSSFSNSIGGVAVGDIGADPRRVSCVMDGGDAVCVNTNFEGDSLTPFVWDGTAETVTIVADITVGDGPVNLNLKLLDGSGGGTAGNVEVLTTGFNDGSIHRTTIAPDGSEVSSESWSVPSECSEPADVMLWDNHFLVGCNGSDNVVKMDISSRR